MRCPASPIIVAIGLCFGSFPVAAAATETTRPQYVEAAEPICKTNTVATQRILTGIREDVRGGKLKLAGGKFSRTARALDSTVAQLERIPRPSEDEGRLERWFSHLTGEVSLLEQVARRLRAGKTTNLGKIVLEIRHNANVANNIVLTFGFEYCLIQPARYI